MQYYRSRFKRSNTAEKIKKKPFYREAPNIPYSGNMEILLGYLKKINSDDGYRITISNGQEWANNLSVKTVIKAIERGHTGIDVFAFIHPHRTVIDWENGYPITRYKAYNLFSHWILDLDGCGMSSVEEILSLYDKARMPRPYCVVKTGPENFHVFVWGEKQDYDDFDKKVGYILKLFGRKFDEFKNWEELEVFFKSYGIDTNIISLSTDWQKIRIPGSVNSKHSKPGKPFVCDGWYNPEFANKAPDVDPAVLKEEPEAIKTEKRKVLYKIKDKQKQIPERISKVIPMLEASLRQHFGKKTSKMFATYFAENINYLNKFELRISQNYLAKQFGIKQPTISKYLKKLCQLGYLQRDDEYIKGQRAKRYKSGEKLTILTMAKEMPSKAKPKEEERREIVRDDYVSGGSNDQMLSDIRYLYRNGVDPENIIRICELKMKNRPVKRRKPINQIECAVRLCEEWNFRNNIIIPPKDKVDSQKMIKELEIIYANE